MRSASSTSPTASLSNASLSEKSRRNGVRADFDGAFAPSAGDFDPNGLVAEIGEDQEALSAVIEREGRDG